MMRAGQDPRTAAAAKFITRLKKLVVALTRQAPGDPIIIGIQRKVTLGSDMVPTRLVEMVGATMYQYRESLYSNDPKVWKQFFDPGDQSQFQSDLERSGDDETRATAEHVIRRTQSIVCRLSDAEQRGYLEIAREMLDLYLDYCTPPAPAEPRRTVSLP